MEKNRVKGFLVCAAFVLAASVGYADGVRNVDVTISDGAGRLAYRGQTDGNGVFVSGQIAPGNYVVQFNAKNAPPNRNDYAIYAAAGRHRIVADAVAGAKLAGAGVAMRVKATGKTVILGQVVAGGVDALGTRIVNGKRYVLVAPRTGDLGPRWVEEGTDTGRNVTRLQIEDGSLIKANNLGAAQ